MKNKIKYIEEIYTDKYRTLYQAILIDVDLDKKSNGLHSKSVRTEINPNLTLLKRRYLTDTYKLVKVLQVQIVTLDYVNVVSSLQKMYPVNEGYRISVVARVPHDIFTSDIIVNVYSCPTLKKKRKVEL